MPNLFNELVAPYRGVSSVVARLLFLLGGASLLLAGGASCAAARDDPSGDEVADVLKGEYGDVFSRYLTVEEATRPPTTWKKTLFGTVVDASTGRPVPGATVGFSSREPGCSGEWWDVWNEQKSTTDGRGRFDLDIPAKTFESQLGSARVISREEAEEHRALFGAFSIHVSHPDFIQETVRLVVPSEHRVVELEPVAGKMCLRWVALDDATGLRLSNAWVDLELVRDPPFPAGPQHLRLPVSLLSDPWPVRATVRAEGYEPIDVEDDPGVGIDRREFRLRQIGTESP